MWYRNLVYLGLFIVSQSSAAATPEKFLCWYYFPDYHEPKDRFLKECDRWCDQVLAGKIAGIPKPAAGSKCTKAPVDAKPDGQWSERMETCGYGGYAACSYHGHSAGYIEDETTGAGVSAPEVALTCLRSSSCSRFDSNSCFGIPPREIIPFLKQFREDVERGKIPLPKSGESTEVQLEQGFFSVDLTSDRVLSTQVTFSLTNNNGQCEVNALYPRCSTASPRTVLNPEGTDNSCFAQYQTYHCQLPKEGKFIDNPLEAKKQVLAAETCCSDPATGAFNYHLCENSGGDPEKLDLLCQCPIPECEDILDVPTKCTGYREYPERRPATIPMCKKKDSSGKVTNVTMCCKDPEASREAKYGDNLGIFAKRTDCPDIIAEEAREAKRRKSVIEDLEAAGVGANKSGSEPRHSTQPRRPIVPTTH